MWKAAAKLLYYLVLNYYQSIYWELQGTYATQQGNSWPALSWPTSHCFEWISTWYLVAHSQFESDGFILVWVVFAGQARFSHACFHVSFSHTILQSICSESERRAWRVWSTQQTLVDRRVVCVIYDTGIHVYFHHHEFKAVCADVTNATFSTVIRKQFYLYELAATEDAEYLEQSLYDVMPLSQPTQIHCTICITELSSQTQGKLL